MAVPFAVATALAWVLMPIGTTIDWSEYLAATALLVCAGALMAGVRGVRGREGVVPEALVFLAAVGVLRDASGGFHSSATVLVLIAVLYTALGTRSRRDLGAVIAAILAFYVVPRLVVGGADYPASQYRSALLFALVSGTTGFTVQSLVASVQAEASKARSRGRMLEEVADTARTLLDSSQVRDDLCAAAERISAASVAALYEPVGGALVCTANTRVDVSGTRIQAAPASLVQAAFLSGQPRYLDADVVAHVGSRELWEGSGSPASILYEPLTHGGEVIGVLLVGWPERVHPDPSRRTVATLIAGQAASVIARSDVLVSLADEAHTDPLTGLSNRRAWDSALARAFTSSSTITLAMLDLDNFKEFNDTHGHPAGDSLLRDTAAAWRDQLRGGDLLARLGGEEFGLLMCDVSSETACEVVARLRACIPEGRTASAGVALRADGESAESLMARADAALYEAKAAGRDRTQVSS